MCTKDQELQKDESVLVLGSVDIPIDGRGNIDGRKVDDGPVPAIGNVLIVAEDLVHGIGNGDRDLLIGK